MVQLNPCHAENVANSYSMKNPLGMISCILATLLPAACQSDSSMGADGKAAAAPKYTAESPLPAGWPEPGPYNEVTRKKYPAYRAAFTLDASPNFGFWRLFKHIKQRDIPMSAPVEMKLDATVATGMKMEQMAFLYQSDKVGQTGVADGRVEVRDIPAQEALSYAWQGTRDDDAIALARAAIDAELAKQKLTATGYRLLGYNSPFMPRAKQTHELQALVR